MSMFRPDNPARLERVTKLQSQAVTFFSEYQRITNDSETQAAQLFECTKTIAQLQNKEIAEFFPPGALYQNAVFEGGFQYIPPDHGDDKGMPKLLYYTLTAALTAASATAYYRAGLALAVMGEGIAGAQAMGVFRILRMGMVAGGEPGFGAGGRIAARLSNFGHLFLGLDVGVQFLNMGLDLYSDEKQHTALVQAIHDLGPLRLNACAYMLMVQKFKDIMLKHATEASVYAKNVTLAAQYDIKENIAAISKEILKVWDEVSSEAFQRVQDIDKKDKPYTADDLALTADSTDLAAKVSPRMTKIELGSDAAVNWISGFTDKGDGIKFGGDGGIAASIDLGGDEHVQSATWSTGMSKDDDKHQKIFNLSIKTNVNLYGPFGNGAGIQADATLQTFTVPAGMRVVGITDLSAEVVTEGEDAVLQSKPFVGELRFVITADK